MASLSLHRTSPHALPQPRVLRSHPVTFPPNKLHFTFKPTTPISCTSKRLTDAALSSELAAEVAKLNTQRAQKQEAIKKSREVLFSEICKSVALKEDEMRKRWRRIEEEERWGLVKEFLGHWGQRFHPLSARSVMEMVEEYLNEEEDSGPRDQHCQVTWAIYREGESRNRERERNRGPYRSEAALTVPLRHQLGT